MPQKLKHIVAFAMAMLMLGSAVPIFSLPICAEDVAQASVSGDDLRAGGEVEPAVVERQRLARIGIHVQFLYRAAIVAFDDNLAARKGLKTLHMRLHLKCGNGI